MKTITAEVEVMGTEPSAGTELQPARIGGQRKFLIGRDKVDLDGLAAQQRADVEWLWKYCRDRDLDREQLDSLVLKDNGKEAYSYDSLYQLFTGRRVKAGVDVAPICDAIAAFRRQVDAQPVTHGFIKTRMAGELWAYVKRAQQRQAVGFVFGDWAVGKTTPMEELARHDASVTYVRMPTRGHLRELLRNLATKLAMGDQQTVHDLSSRVINAFGPGDVLVIDEADQAFTAMKKSLGLATLDFLRELWDKARCGIVLVMDTAGRDQFLRGENKARLQRLWRRRLPMLQLPSVPYADDLVLFAAKFGLPPATAEEIEITYVDLGGVKRKHRDAPARLQHAVLSDSDGGLFVWLNMLADARAEADALKRPVTWGAVIKAHAAFVAAETFTEGGK
jgi:DNA transposition AAA+ family ATPase